jgi:hypothetical protein
MLPLPALLTAPLLQGISAQQLLNLLGYIVFLFTSSIGGVGLWGLQRIGSVSNELPVSVTPAGYAFSIWSAIFVLTGLLSVLQVLPRNREWAAEKLGWWWLLNTIIGEGLWTFAFILRWGSMWVSAALLGFIVLTGALLYLQMGIGIAPWPLQQQQQQQQQQASRCAQLTGLTVARPPVSLLEAGLLESGISMYVGWTTAATILNISIALSLSGLSGSGWSITVVAAAAVLAVLGAASRTDFIFSGTLCWALTAIHRNQVALGLNGDSVGEASLAAAVVSGVAAGLALAWRLLLIVQGRVTFVSSSVALSSGGSSSSAKAQAQAVGSANGDTSVVVVTNVAAGQEWK